MATPTYNPCISIEEAVARAQSHPDPKVRSYNIRSKEHFFENVLRYFRDKPCTPETYQDQFDQFMKLYLERTGIVGAFWITQDDSIPHTLLETVTFALVFSQA
jgi:hypothetical protein